MTNPASTTGRPEAPPAWWELRAGWPALAASMIGCAVGSTAIPPYTIGLFLKPLAQDFDVPRSAMALVFTLVTFSIAVASPLVGRLVDRVGVFTAVAFANTAQVVGFLLLSALPKVYGLFLPLTLIVWVLASAAGPIALARLVTSQFDRFRGRALGINLAGIGIAAMLAPSFVQIAIGAGGWRAGYRLIALITAFGTPLVLFLIKVAQHRLSPARQPATQSKPAGTGTLDARLLRRLTVCFALLGFSILGYLVHFVPILTDAGVSPARAALLQSVVGATLVLVRIFFGFLLDRFFAPRVASGVAVITALGLMTLALLGSKVALVGAIAIGLGAGAEVDFIAYLTSRYFARDMYSRVYGWLYGGLMVGGACAPLLLARLFEVSGAYTVGLFLSSSTLVVAAVLFWRLPRFPALQGSEAVPSH